MLGDVGEHGVAARAAERVVDLAKVVEVDERESDEPGTAVRQRMPEMLHHDRAIRQPGQKVLAGQLSHHLVAAVERLREPPRGAHREKPAQREDGTDHGEQDPQPVHGADQGAFAHPAEPADDSPAAVMERLDLAAALGGRIEIEPQILQAGAALDFAKVAGVQAFDVTVVETVLIERGAQSRALLGFDAGFAELRDGKTDRRAKQRRAGEKDRQIKGDARRPALGARLGGCRCGRGRALASRRPPFPGCRSRRHLLRASLTEFRVEPLCGVIRRAGPVAAGAVRSVNIALILDSVVSESEGCSRRSMQHEGRFRLGHAGVTGVS